MIWGICACHHIAHQDLNTHSAETLQSFVQNWLRLVQLLAAGQLHWTAVAQPHLLHPPSFQQSPQQHLAAAQHLAGPGLQRLTHLQCTQYFWLSTSFPLISVCFSHCCLANRKDSARLWLRPAAAQHLAGRGLQRLTHLQHQQALLRLLRLADDK